MSKDIETLDELLRLVELDARIRDGSLISKLPEPKPLESVLETLKRTGVVKRTGAVDGRVAEGKRRKKANATRKRNNARQARWRRNWKERQLTKALEQGDWFDYIRRRWVDQRRKWVIEKEEWDMYVLPCIEAGVDIQMRRYDTKAPTSLENIVVYNASTGAVLFDGQEHKMRVLGFAL